MLHICTAKNRHLYQAQLREMHKQRYELFVRTRGWNLSVRDEGEYDEGDDDRATYLLSLDETGGCFGSIRVRPADDFSMMIDAMPQYVAGGAEALREEPGLWEMARWVNIAGDAGAGQEVRIGLVEYLLRQGARRCLALPDVSMMAYSIRTGWRLKALGPPLPYPEGGVAIATYLPITSEEAAYLRQLTGRHDPFFVDIDPEAAWATLPLPTVQKGYLAVAEGAVSDQDLMARADEHLRRVARETIAA